MKWRLLLALAVVLLIAAGPKEEVPLTVPSLEGTWRVIGYENENGYETCSENHTLEIDRSKLRWFEGKECAGEYTLRFPPDTDPPVIEGRRENLEAASLLYIYSLEGSALKLCWRLDRDRPRTFRQSKGSGQMVILLERITP